MTVASRNADTDPLLVRARGAIRRMAVTLTSQVLWQLAGFRMPDQSREAFNAEVFGGIGIYARPPDSTQPEAIVLMVGDAKAPAIVAVRDEATRAAVAGALKADETMVFNSEVCMHATADGHVDLRAASGAASVQPMILGTSYRTAEDTLLTALGTFATAIGALNPATSAGAATTLVAAISTFQTAAASYLAQVGRVQ